VAEPFVKSVRLTAPRPDERRAGYPWELPVIGQLANGLDLHPRVTYLIGENGSGKSTLLAGIAMAAGMNPEGDALDAYGGTSLHEQSHGEGFLALMINRFGPNGFYLLDEPEAALSTQNCLTCLRRIHELVEQGSQFVISTHSPIILAYPEATVYRCTGAGLEPTEYEDAEPVRLTTSFLSARERFLDRLFGCD
jgi:predicted ATPase